MDALTNRITARLEQLLTAIPVPLRIEGWYDRSADHAGAVWFKVRSDEHIEEICDYSDRFAEMSRVLTQEFGTEIGSSIAVDAPPQLRGPGAVLNQNEIDRNKVEFSKARLKDLPHG
jgi:hypothetical protein